MQKVSYQFSESIWKVLPFSQGKLVLELRDKNNYTSSWKIINSNESHVSFTYKIEDNSWWWSLVDCFPPYLFLHELRQGKIPEIVRTKEINSTSFNQEVIHENKFLTEVTNTSYILANKNGEREKIPFSNETENKSSVSKTHLYLETSEYFDSFKEIILSYTGNEAIKQCEYAEFNDLISLSFFIERDRNLSCHLIVLDKEGNLLLHDELAQNLSGIYTESFSVIENKIVFVKNENEIHIFG